MLIKRYTIHIHVVRHFISSIKLNIRATRETRRVKNRKNSAASTEYYLTQGSGSRTFCNYSVHVKQRGTAGVTGNRSTAYYRA